MNNELELDKALVSDLEHAFARSGWTELQVRQACGGQFLSDIRSVLVGLAKIVPNRRRHITVDYNMSWHEMLAARNYGWISPDITPERFPIKGEGKVEFETEEFFFNYNISSKHAVQLIRDEDPQNPWEPAQTEHAFAYGAQHPEQQSKYPIICLGSVANVGPRPFVIRLYRGGADPFLFLYANDWDGGWVALCRFLAVRRSRT